MTLPTTIGPILFARGTDEFQCELSAVVVTPDNVAPPLVGPADGEGVRPARLYSQFGRTVWRYDFRLPAREDATYRFGNATFPVAADLSKDVRIAYVSCNGQEHADADRPAAERNAMWRRLATEHARTPFGLLLHGGDQLYADEVFQSHPALARWAETARAKKTEQVFSEDMRKAAESHYFHRYLMLLAQPEIAHLVARVPSLMMWDDHDIFDGWGSLPEKLLDGQVGRGLFDIARRMFMLFQVGATDKIPLVGEDGSQDRSLTQVIRFPRLSVIAPDLRSERRPTQVMGPAGWATFERALAQTNSGDQILVMSSVPILGPRLSWIEKLLDLLPGVQKYEDDMLDQWQSKAHRPEWQRMLETLQRRATEGRNPITVLSGEIHLATRGEMAFTDGTIMHQLVASGIAHLPPPLSYACVLGYLAALGESPLPGQPVHLKPLPGHRQIYAAERNYAVINRRGEEWSVEWELEVSGRTPAMALEGSHG
ncbi:MULTISPECIES: alkaline phosphatase D family protein [Polaromonas]|uniref:Alkaline phosphatase D family protein n=1 Tax=Polaromonas aquatica TaxID=332657 RepID=A0ABW1TWP7_9BURK